MWDQREHRRSGPLGTRAGPGPLLSEKQLQAPTSWAGTEPERVGWATWMGRHHQARGLEQPLKAGCHLSSHICMGFDTADAS